MPASDGGCSIPSATFSRDINATNSSHAMITPTAISTMRHVNGRRSPESSRGGSPAPGETDGRRDCVMIAIAMIAIDTVSIATTANRLPKPLVGRSRGGGSRAGQISVQRGGSHDQQHDHGDDARWRLVDPRHRPPLDWSPTAVATGGPDPILVAVSSTSQQYG